MAWQAAIRDSGKALRAIVAEQAPQELAFQLQRRKDELIAADLEKRRQEASRFDQAARTRELDHMSDVQQRLAIELRELDHKLTQQAEDAASRRRINEQLATTDRELTKLIVEAWLRTSGTTSAQQTVDATNLVNAEIRRIRRDPDLTPDEQHLQIKTLLDTLPQMLRNLRPNDV